MHKQIRIIPKVPEIDDEEMSFITIIFNQFLVNSLNADFKRSIVRFDIICPFDEWIVNDNNLRPYLLM